MAGATWVGFSILKGSALKDEPPLSINLNKHTANTAIAGKWVEQVAVPTSSTEVKLSSGSLDRCCTARRSFTPSQRGLPPCCSRSASALRFAMKLVDGFTIPLLQARVERQASLKILLRLDRCLLP
jgi:hypothetical protein